MVFPRSIPQNNLSRIRLINVHLDSLPIEPSRRPRQLTILSPVFAPLAASRGLVAGDFNPVLPEDANLVRDNNLVDAWTELHPDENGFTWGVDGKQRFHPIRLDKVAMLGLKAYDIQVIPPGKCMDTNGLELQRRDSASSAQESGQRHECDSVLQWSDHHGLVCSFWNRGHIVKISLLDTGYRSMKFAFQQ